MNMVHIPFYNTLNFHKKFFEKYHICNKLHFEKNLCQSLFHFTVL